MESSTICMNPKVNTKWMGINHKSPKINLIFVWGCLTQQIHFINPSKIILSISIIFLMHRLARNKSINHGFVATYFKQQLGFKMGRKIRFSPLLPTLDLCNALLQALIPHLSPPKPLQKSSFPLP